MTLLTERSLASRWGVSIRTVRRLRESGALDFIRIGRAVRYEERFIEQYEREQRTEAVCVTLPRRRA